MCLVLEFGGFGWFSVGFWVNFPFLVVVVHSGHFCWWVSWNDCPERIGAESCWWGYDISRWSWFWIVWGEKEVFVLVHVCQKGRDVGCLMVGKVVVLFEGSPRLGKESVASFTCTLPFALRFCCFVWLSGSLGGLRGLGISVKVAGRQ